jgi:hypothetical protein
MERGACGVACCVGCGLWAWGGAVAAAVAVAGKAPLQAAGLALRVLDTMWPVLCVVP